MSATTEAGLVSQIIRKVKATYPGTWVFKVVGSPYQESGIPDLLLCVQGLTCGIEVKHVKPGESVEHARDRATTSQRLQIWRINRAGGIAGVAVSVDEALEIIERGLKHRKVGEHDAEAMEEGPSGVADGGFDGPAQGWSLGPA